MCRGCYLTGHTDEIAECYDIGKEIDTYSSAEEFVAKTRFYLANDTAAENLRSAGYGRARRDHTWERRFRELFAKTGLSLSARA
jgi:spore maturation protein CgeB